VLGYIGVSRPRRVLLDVVVVTFPIDSSPYFTHRGLLSSCVQRREVAS